MPNCTFWLMSASSNVRFDQCLLQPVFALTNVCSDQCPLWPISASTNVCFDQCPLWPMSALTNVRFDQCPLWPVSAPPSCLVDCSSIHLEVWLLIEFFGFILMQRFPPYFASAFFNMEMKCSCHESNSRATKRLLQSRLEGDTEAYRRKRGCFR